MKSFKLLILLFCASLLLSCGFSRHEVRVSADVDLVGYYHRLPFLWDKDRFAPHVSFTDEYGREQWLFESYLFIEASDGKRGLTMSIAPDGHSARKESWQDQLNLWLGPEGGVANLEKACAEVASRIGKPSQKRQVIITVPDAIMFEHFADKNSATKYWGEVDGRELDFADVNDQLSALYWYIDTSRKMFASLRCKYLELGGFYVVSEDLPVAYGETEQESFNAKYKRWESIAPALSAYCHKRGEGLYWIPYHMAAGYRFWKKLGFDMAWMQPNYYWDLKSPGRHPFDKTLDAVREYGMGMELEFEYSLVSDVMKEVKKGPDGAGRMIFDEEDVPALKEQFRDYLRNFKDTGLYGVAPIALYSGSNALTQLAGSTSPEDRALYLELCKFVVNSPLRHQAPAPKTAQSLPYSIESLWRMYYNTPDEKEIQISAADQNPVIYDLDDEIRVVYDGLVCRGEKLDIGLVLTLKKEDDGSVRFGATVSNNMPHTIIRELQYPLIADLQLPKGYKLLTTHTGGRLYDNPLKAILDIPQATVYMKPDQKFRQMDLQYPRNAASNCFAFVGEKDGIYFGSHDESFQQTWHGLRAYPSAPGCFDRLEAGFYRYPNIFCGETWSNDASVIVPYKGDWTETSRIYRRWADAWWDKQDVPQWVKEMTGWQRIIFKHQYGEYLRHYTDLPGRIFEAGEKAGSDAVLAFGWWKEGMDNGYPDYTPDDTQGGDAAWKEQIAEYKAKGGHLILYYNGRLIDNASDFYRSGEASRVSNHDNTGDEFTEHYKFTGEGTTLGYYDSRTFVVADMSKREWRDQLLKWADRAMELGANSVFYDQLGVAEEFPQWDLSREYPVPDIFTGRYKADALREIRDHIKAKDPEFCLGTEWLSDCTSRYCDFVHIVEFTALPESFPEWFRYTFPEVIWSDRCVRDEVDMVRRVNNTLVKGLRNDIEVFRCRGLIDETPAYQEYLGKINALRRKYPLLLEGRFAWHDDFELSNPAITACEFAGEDCMAIVMTSENRGYETSWLKVPGYELVEASTLGDARANATSVRLGQYGIAVLLFRKEGK